MEGLLSTGPTPSSLFAIECNTSIPGSDAIHCSVIVLSVVQCSPLNHDVIYPPLHSRNTVQCWPAYNTQYNAQCNVIYYPLYNDLNNALYNGLNSALFNKLYNALYIVP